ncbi:hypothetical protein [Sphingomonas sp. Leaf62]|uniref:hypothetical protein n=1 Tax=Sphingomonas sp. Leaf62 TaxID=1736228 RepID=UPI000AD699AC|nr:hypothetical protein [Sphingomonas sp. Leaf62]
MCKSGVQPTAAAFRAEALARWDNEGGALSYGATVVPPVVDARHHLSDDELVHLRSQVIALEQTMIAMMAGGSDDQRALIHDMAAFVRPPMDAVQDPLMIHAGDLMDHMADRATLLARVLG